MPTKRFPCPATLGHYATLRREFDNAGAHDFREPALNELGYKVLAKEDVRGAVAVFRANAAQFPESANVWDSLGEAYLASGDSAQAIAQYEKVLQIQPQNEHAAEVLAKLRSSDRR